MKGGGGSSAQYYYEDYYIEGGGSQGQWYGKGAQLLGLAGPVKINHFKSLLAGFAPNGTEKLAQNAGNEYRQQGWDLCFSPVKSVSVLYAMSSPEVQAQIGRCIRKAAEHALNLVEENAGLTRRGPGGMFVEPASLIFATFNHLTSRANDPQLHVHAVLINAAVRYDGSTVYPPTPALWG